MTPRPSHPGLARLGATSFLLVLSATLLAISGMSGSASAEGCVSYQDYLHLVGYVSPIVTAPGSDTYSRGVAVQGSHAYLACGRGGLKIIDVSEPTNPVVVATFAPLQRKTRRVVVSGNCAYACETSSGLTLLDITNPAAPVQFSYLNPSVVGPTTEDVSVQGGYAYVAAGSAGLRVVNVSDPHAPSLVTTEGVGATAFRVVAATSAAGTPYAFVSFGSAVAVFDITDPLNPIRRGNINTFGADVELMGNHVLVASGAAGLKIYSMENPGPPVLVATMDTPLWAESIQVRGNLAFIGDGLQSGLLIVDVSDPTAPWLVSSKPLDEAWDVAVQGDFAYVADYFGLAVVSIASTQAVGGFASGLPFSPRDIAVVGDHAYVLSNESDAGLAVYDLSIPALPRWTGTATVQDDPATAIAATGTTLAVVSSGELTTVDVSAPETPVVVGQTTLPAPPSESWLVRAVASGGRVYMTRGISAYARVADISDPSTPVVRGSFGVSAQGIAIANGHAYLARGYDRGLEIFELSNPDTPHSVGRAMGHWAHPIAWDVAVHGQSAFVAGSLNYVGRDPGFMDVFDVSNPATPMLIAALNLPYAINRIVIAGNLAYLRSLSNVEVIDISDPATPRIVADFAPLYATEDYRRTMAAFGDHILFGYTSPGQGIQSMPQQCALSTSVPGAGVSHETRGVRLDVAPNPGRRTSIGFSMPASGAATLEVIDVTGRRVMSLHAGVLAAGTWTFGWDGRDASGAEAAPGIYFIALRTETGSRSERFVLAR